MNSFLCYLSLQISCILISSTRLIPLLKHDSNICHILFLIGFHFDIFISLRMLILQTSLWSRTMATLTDIGVAAAINILSACIFLIAFAFLRIQPVNDRVYFPKWYLKGLRSSPLHSGTIVNKFVNLDFRAYLKFLNWMPDALQMPEPELIDHAGLDSAVYLRIYLIGYLHLSLSLLVFHFLH